MSGTQPAEAIFLNPLDWYAANGIALYRDVQVTGIDRAGKDAHWQGDDKLLIATGSRPFMPPLEGLVGRDGKYKRGPFVFPTIEDCRRIARHARESRRAAVIGGGLLGLEAARGVLGYGCEVHVLELGPHLMTQQLDPQAGLILKSTMEAMGVR